MTLIRNTVLVVLLAAFAVPVSAQQLTKAEIEQAVAAGLETKPDKIGLHKVGSRTEVYDANARQVKMGVSIYTPTAWIQLQAAKAKAQYRTFSASDVTAEMTRPVVRVFVKPYVAHNLVLRSSDESAAIQPVSGDFCQEMMEFGDGVAWPDQCQEFLFSTDDLVKVRNEKGEFLATVIGVRGDVLSSNMRPGEWNFGIKQGDLVKLPGLK